MGIFWDLIQLDELEEQQKQADSIEEKAALLEEDLIKTKALLKKTLVALEKHISKDIDGDGKMG